MKNIYPRAFGALCLVLPFFATAGVYDYSYIEGGYFNLDRGRRGGDDSGLRIAGSADIAAPIALTGELADAGDYTQVTGGLLFHTPLSALLDFQAGLTLDHVDVGSDDDLGVGLRGGVRWEIMQRPRRLEVAGEVRHLFVFSDSTTSLRASVLYRIAEALDLQGAVQAGDDDRVEVGLRYNFNTPGNYESGRRL